MKRALVFACLVVAGVLSSAAKTNRVCEDLGDMLAVRGETVTVTGLWAMVSESLSPDAAALTVRDGDLIFCPGTLFQTDDLNRLKETGGALLWQVENGRVSGAPTLDPPTDQWRIEIADDGRVGRLVPIVVESSFFASCTRGLADLGDQFRRCFFVNQRWKYLTDGLLVTIEVALCSVLLGALIGFLVAIVRSTHDKSGRFPVLNAAMKVYLTVIRGTPMAVQLLIAYFIIFASCNNKMLVAILAFGLNSGAYVAEIMRAGIVSIDPGQMEAGRSLGLSYARSMIKIILPQAVRNVLPALGNEFIVLLKDTSIASFIALQDLAKGGEIIRSQTYNVYMPFLMVAAVYLVLVMFFTWVLGKLERHLRRTGADVVGNKS